MRIDDNNSRSRRNLLKKSGAIGLGAISLSGSAGAHDESVRNLHSEDDFKAENYVEREEFIYRRVQTAETEMLLRLDLGKGEAVFAEMKYARTAEGLTDSPMDGSVEILSKLQIQSVV
ncbi:hypothetical protein EA462_11830 [Natrarchaeobius halalkaliphilus]|uniref:Twin-arginine translocation signal domain-containing protein n=1 Tax=Natrarchaeobius halalkaliphilus TaxID=1679091 RepID=A0A3N6M1V0_9EURY|nr:hypothetical protein [Natrarchaeobius halalkaliphilus]RQG89061.1 hypothetical protein EA462_11830 [Natrarchaeobius halalkaliphilus]